ncbi:MAG: peroxidase family protein [Erythrobacter sp.]|uniref:peroxidase family protein n=1 Tax=Erythrobacter sp. TaxID=1042 RepID=UPI002B470A73|nr:peroxidase family protein [Erythrobacter sp.]WRH70166.1 MAG: peroxidase family protein [Erythrobacter sp.]
MSGEYNNLVNQSAGSADQLMPRQTAPVWNAADVNPRTGEPTSYASLSGSVYDAEPRIISNLIADQSLRNPIAVVSALNYVGITSGALYDAAMTAAETARIAIRAADAADKALVAADAALLAAGAPTSGAEFDARQEAAQTRDAAYAARDAAMIEATAQLSLAGVEMQNGNLVLPNVMTDLGSTAPLNGFMTIFGQFFDHGLTMIDKGGSGSVFIPLQPDDPLYVPGSPTNFMVLTRATNQPGADGILGTADDIREATNDTTPWIDLNQTYASNESHQVFLREYKLVDGKPVATGWLLEGANGGPPTWADIKLQAREKLGIELSDMNVHDVPLLATDLYGNFIPGANGFPQLVTGPDTLVEGNLATPVSTSGAMSTGHVFLADIAHNADPKAGQTADADSDVGNAIPLDARGNRATYDNELLDKHYIVGDGRGNENIALTALHHVFHSEHNRRVDQIKAELIANGDVALLNEWLLVEVAEIPADLTTMQWHGERLFQAARFTTEQVYQHLVFEEFARLVNPNIDAFVFSNTVDIDPAITAEFAHAVYRFGHSQLNETVPMISADGQTQTDMTLVEAFLNPVAFATAGTNPDAAAGAIIRGMSRQVSNEIDEYVTDALRNDLVGLPLDLAALNIARARDTGVPSLNAVRADFFAKTGDTQLEPYSSWFDFALAIKTPASVINFIAAYGQHPDILNAVTVDEKRDAAFNLVLGGAAAPADALDFLNGTGAWAGQETGLNLVDFWIGGLAEKKMAFNGLLGSTFTFVFEAQIENLQAGDRFYYLSRSQGMNLLNELEGDSWAKLAMRNTDLEAADATHLPSSLFLTPAYILELNQSLQNMADPVHDNFILQAISPMVIRKDTDGDGVNDYLRFTGVDHVVLGGTEASDTLIGGEGDDTLWGGSGDDRLEGGQGVDHISGGYGDDIITDSGTPTGAADVLSGEDGNDVISAGEGLDLIFGGRGQDFIIGGRDGKTVTSGEGNDFARGGEAASIVQGNEGDDWLEGGVGGVDVLAGENSELFFNSPIIGHDVLNGRGNDNDYDAESGDDIMFQGLGVQRNNGMAGFDWAINKDNPVAADSDLGVPIFVNQQANILRDRYDLVEGLSGWKFDDMLTGRDFVAGQAGVGGAAAVFDPTAPFLSYSNALTSEGVARINGLTDLVAHLGRATINAPTGETHEVVVFDEADIVRDADGNATGINGAPHDMILGGGGSDIIQGKAGNDIIDGDRWLNVRIGINDVNGNPMASAEHMTSKVVDLEGNLLFGGKTLDQLMLSCELNPGQLNIVREILDGNQANDQDVAVYRDVLTNYSFVRNADGSTTITHAIVPPGIESDGVDRLLNIEKLGFSDGNGGTIFYDINAVVPVAASGAPTISNSVPTEREVLTVDLTGIIDPNGVINPTLQWQMSSDGGVTWTDIVGAVDATFIPGQDQVGAQLRVNVAYFDLTGTFENLNSAPTAIVADFAEAATGAAIISDTTPFAGQVLTIDTTTIADANGVGPLSHQWQVSADNGVTWTNIDGATGTSYTPVLEQIGSLLQVVTTFTDITTGTLETLTSAATAAIVEGPIAATGAPVISNLTPTETQALTIDVSGIADINGVGTLSHQWQASTDNGVTWTDIAGATEASFTPAQAQVGSILRVSTSFTDGLGTVEVLVSAQTAPVADLLEAATGAAIISDTTPFSDQVLTIDTATIADANGVGPLSHQWQASADNGATWTNINGATGTSYTPTQAQIGSLLQVVTTFTDITTGTLETLTSAATAAIVRGPTPATGAPVISDLTPTETQALTLNVSSIADLNGVGTLSYQWQSSTNNGVTWTNIAGATAASFTPAQAQVGSILRVSASFTDGLGTVETLTSSVTGVVGDNWTGVPVTLTTFTGTAGDDIANGADASNALGGSDTMNGFAGNDTLNGRGGNDVITGGAGNDIINGGASADTAVYAGASSNFTLSSNGTNITVTDNTGAEGVDTVSLVETLRFNGANHSVVTGTALGNTMSGAAANEAIFALAGNDTINGGGGNDLIYANGGVDSITQDSGTGGRDFVDGGADEDTFTVTTDTTTAEAFVIYTRAAALNAIPGLTLNANTEIVITRNGRLMSELDNIEEIVVSTLRVTSPGGANGGTVSGDTISVVGDFNQTSLNFNTITIDGNTGNDTVDISALESAHRIVFTSNGGQDTIIGDLRPQDIVNMDPNAVTPSHHATALPTAEKAAPAVTEAPAPVMEAIKVATDEPAPVMETFKSAAAEPAPVLDQQLQGGSASDILVAGLGDDRLSGGSNDDYLFGMEGDDFLSGGSGNDGVDGGEGDDTLSGGSGNDYLDGGAGDDELTGGTGNDTFAFGNGDTVTDFAVDQDMIDLSAMGVTAANFAEMVSITAVRGGARITIGTESMLIANVSPTALTAAQFTLAAEASAQVTQEPAAPSEATPAPVVVELAAPSEATPAPVAVELAAPSEATPAPVAVELAAPSEATPAPVVVELAAPSEATPAPVVVELAAPSEETPAPVVVELAAPSEATPAPVVVELAAPSEETPAPVVVELAAPSEATPAPVAVELAAPSEATPAPVVVELAAPSEATPAPVVVELAAPSEATPAPVAVELAAPSEKPPVVEEPVSLDQTGTSRSEVLFGAAGDDVLFGIGGHDRLHGGAGDDMLIGGRGRDILFGGEGIDTLSGGKGADYLDGGEGADVLFGGKGSDAFVFGDGDLVLDFRSDDDLIDLTALGITEATFEEQVSFTRMGNDTMISVGSQSMTLKNTQQVDMDDFRLAEETAIDKLLSDALAVIESQSSSPVANIGGDESSPVADRAMLADLPPYPMLESGMLPIRPLEDDFITPMM